MRYKFQRILLVDADSVDEARAKLLQYQPHTEGEWELVEEDECL